MAKNYFSIERNGNCIDQTLLIRADGKVAFEDVMNMSYDEIKAYNNIDEFVEAVMEAANTYFKEGDVQTLITLVGEDDVFIWGILIGPGENSGELKYVFIDWGKDGKKYRYEKN